MRDTPSEMENLQREMIQRLTPTERAEMGSSMFDTARELMESGFRSRNPQANGEEMRRLIFNSLYSKDFEMSRWKKIEACLFPPDPSGSFEKRESPDE